MTRKDKGSGAFDWTAQCEQAFQKLKKLLVTAFAGHFSATKLKKKLDLLYYWPGMMGDAYEKCACCVVYASSVDQMKSIPVSGPFEVVGMNFKEMDLSQSSNKYALGLQESSGLK